VSLESLQRAEGWSPDAALAQVDGHDTGTIGCALDIDRGHTKVGFQDGWLQAAGTQARGGVGEINVPHTSL